MLLQNQVNHLMTSKSGESSSTLCTVVQSDNSKLWIVDTGATDHVCHTLSLFQCHKRIRHVNVRLPDGSQITTHTAGTVVLFIPSFTLNLISVSKLTHAADCKLIFDDGGCRIQDKVTLRTIGVARADGGFYTISPQASFQFAPHIVNTFNSYKHDIWNLRLGHPSHEKLVQLHRDFSFIDCNKIANPCDTCHLAKQKKLPFPDSVSVSENLFDMLHMDIWGPISEPSMLGHRYFLTVVDDATRHTWIFS